ncbi:hypothetical protein [Spirilliplanes yamanashiensis]|uniref:hypothetical protein n=1 Tax=Spirilliplanes yamanashiensis TaxID=42233 RepID=UPI001951CAF2|nr:hypothetical protein [Spirilliplanes yamanashiensis]MDP9816718.1 hypothetical protein [Spirilliplanes yamanashiensis]
MMTRNRRRVRVLSYLGLALMFLCGGFAVLWINPGGAAGTPAIVAVLAGEVAAAALVVREANALKREDAARAAGQPGQPAARRT